MTTNPTVLERLRARVAPPTPAEAPTPSEDVRDLVDSFRVRPPPPTRRAARTDVGPDLAERAERAGLTWHPEELLHYHRSTSWRRGPIVLVARSDGRWWWAPETWGYADLVRHAPRFDTEAVALLACVRWIESGKPPPAVPEDERARRHS